MIKEIIQTGASVDAAIESGCLLLGVSRSEAEFEIISLPRKTLFGLKTIPAKVKVFVELPDPEPAPAPVVEPKKSAPAAPKSAQKPQATPAPDADKQSQPARSEDTSFTPTPSAVAKGEVVEAYVRSVLGEMDATDLHISARHTSNGLRLALSGADVSSVIGRRGETMDALQYLAGLVANRVEGDYLRVTIDSGNYRAKRERTLETLARRLAIQVSKTGRNQILEPMNPYERRIIHAMVSQINGATSASIGEEPYRRVVIKSTNPAPRGGGGGGGRAGRRPGKPIGYDKGGGRERSGGGQRKDYNPQQAKPTTPAPPTSTVAPKPAEQDKNIEKQGVHLYGKIEL